MIALSSNRWHSLITDLSYLSIVDTCDILVYQMHHRHVIGPKWLIQICIIN